MKEYLKYFGVGLSYYTGIIFISLAYFLNHSSSTLSESVFLFYDSIHYYNVALQGYNSHYEVAFFPLFPFIWKFSGTSLIGISFINTLAYISCITVVGKSEKLSSINYLIALALPSAVFYFIPYSEAFYFACSILLLYGIKENKFYIEIGGIFLCCFCRPVLPIILISVLLFSFYEKSTFYKALIRSFIAVAGTLLAFFVHWIYTGNFFSYFSAFNTWNYNFRFPLLPLKSGGGDLITQIDGYALLYGLISILLIVKLIKNSPRKNKINNYEFFSLTYLSFFTLLILGLMRGGSLTSMNRFMFCSPFFIVAFIYIEKHFIEMKNLKNIFKLLLALIVFGLLFQSYVHIQSFIKYFLVAAVFAVYLAKEHYVFRSVNIEKSILLLMLILLQLIFVNKFLSGEWIA